MSDWPSSGAPFGTPAITLDDVAADGVAATTVRSDATVVAFDDSGVPSASAPGDAAADGTANFASRKDHKHSREAFATPTVTLGSAAAAGAAGTLLRSDCTIAAFDGTAPTASAPGDAAAVGTAAFAARRDHRHAREEYIFYDDFMYDPQTDPAPGASGVWRTGNQGAGGTWSRVSNEDAAFGVHQLASLTTPGDVLSIHVWERATPAVPFFLVPGIEIGFRIRRDASDFTQAALAFSIGDGFSGDNSAAHFLKFLIHFETVAVVDRYRFIVLDTAQSPTFLAFDIATTNAAWHNVKFIVTSSAVIDCYFDGTLVHTFSGVQVPSSTRPMGIQIHQGTYGIAPGATQKGYIDLVYIDTSRIDRGAF